MFNLNKFDTQKEIWEEPSLVDEVQDSNWNGRWIYFNMLYSKKLTMEELEKMFKEN